MDDNNFDDLTIRRHIMEDYLCSVCRNKRNEANKVEAFGPSAILSADGGWQIYNAALFNDEKKFNLTDRFLCEP